jgi:hypothetical protein
MFAVAAVAAAAGLIAGCQVDTHKDGDSDNVKVSTPFGGVQVKTNDSVQVETIGLPLYPGAVLVKKDKDNDAADVNMSFGSFHLRVKAVGYRTDDSPDKVEAFYRDGLKRYGDVVKCRDGQAIGTPVKTLAGLTCDDKKQNHITVNDESGKHSLELKAGSQQTQHIVEIDPDGSGTKFGLVALDLPGKISSGSEDDDTRQ